MFFYEQCDQQCEYLFCIFFIFYVYFICDFYILFVFFCLNVFRYIKKNDNKSFLIILSRLLRLDLVSIPHIITHCFVFPLQIILARWISVQRQVTGNDAINSDPLVHPSQRVKTSSAVYARLMDYSTDSDSTFPM